MKLLNRFKTASTHECKNCKHAAIFKSVWATGDLEASEGMCLKSASIVYCGNTASKLQECPDWEKRSANPPIVIYYDERNQF